MSKEKVKPLLGGIWVIIKIRITKFILIFYLSQNEQKVRNWKIKTTCFFLLPLPAESHSLIDNVIFSYILSQQGNVDTWQTSEGSLKAAFSQGLVSEVQICLNVSFTVGEAISSNVCAECYKGKLTSFGVTKPLVQSRLQDSLCDPGQVTILCGSVFSCIKQACEFFV